MEVVLPKDRDTLDVLIVGSNISDLLLPRTMQKGTNDIKNFCGHENFMEKNT